MITAAPQLFYNSNFNVKLFEEKENGKNLKSLTNTIYKDRIYKVEVLVKSSHILH